MDFKDKVIVITGGANGIGRCMVSTFAEKGARIAFIDKDEERGNALSSILDEGHMFYAGDLAKESVLTNFAEAVAAKYKKVDALINNACFSNGGILSGCSFEDFNTVLKVGVTAPYMLTKLFLPYFSTSAAVVNIASSRAFMSQQDTESYTAAKGGIVALTHALAVSLAGKVRVNCISPGWIDNSGTSFSPEDHAQHPAGRIGRPEDITAAVEFLISDAASFITGENLMVDGGMTKLMIYHNDLGWEYKKG